MLTATDTTKLSVREHVLDALKQTDAYPDPAVWIYRLPREAVLAQVDSAIERCEAGEDLPLLGLTLAVKDNIDVAGIPTTAACPDYSYVPSESATVVARLVQAGAIVIGKTNLDQFATGLVGTRSPYGACRNVFDASYIAGGSSSGSGVAVAAGLVDIALGTDTAGSGRVPAAFGNTLGLKPTCGRLSAAGVVPACRSLDCVSIFSRTVELARRALAVAEGGDEKDIYSRSMEDLPAYRPASGQGAFTFAVASLSQLEFLGNDAMRQLYEAACERLVALGGERVVIDLSPFLEAARFLYDGPWVAERLFAAGRLLRERPASLWPTTRAILEAAAARSAAEGFVAMYRLRELKRMADRQLANADLLVLPTTGTIYRIDEVEADPLRLNQNLGYYTNFVNLLDFCAVAVPGGFLSNGLPGGVTLIGRAGSDVAMLEIADRFLGKKFVGGVQ